MSVLRCDGCFEDYPEQTYTVRGSERPWLDIRLTYGEAMHDILEGWTITVHRHHREEVNRERDPIRDIAS